MLEFKIESSDDMIEIEEYLKLDNLNGCYTIKNIFYSNLEISQLIDMLIHDGYSKIRIINYIRNMFGLSIMDASDIVNRYLV